MIIILLLNLFIFVGIMANKLLFYRHKNPKLNFPEKIDHGFGYHCYHTVGDTRYIRCYKRASDNCPARGKMLNGKPVLTKGHDHPGNPKLILYYKFQEELYQSTVAKPYQSFRIIYDYLCKKHHEAAVIYTWAKMKPVMEQWRRRDRPLRPPIPRDLIEYANYFNLPEYSPLTSYSKGQLTATTLQDPDGQSLTVIYDANFVRSVQSDTIFMDATFKVKPPEPKSYQFFTILAAINNNALPICWILMTTKSANAYQTGLNYFKTQVAPHINPTIIMTDFEAGLRVALRHVYPLSTHIGCFFHFTQALTKRLKKHGLIRRFSTWKYGQIIIRKFMGLAFLPAADVLQAYNWLLENIPREIFAVLQPFIEYFHDQWILSTPPHLWSIFNCVHRTNNFTESYHSKLNLRFGVHSAIWEFTEKLTTLQAVTRAEFESLKNGDTITRDRSLTEQNKDVKVRRAWNLYATQRLDIPEFLACASNFILAFKHRFRNAAGVADYNAAYERLAIFSERDVLDI